MVALSDEGNQPNPVDQVSPKASCQGGDRYHPPAYASRYAGTGMPADTMGRIFVGLLLILVAWILSSVHYHVDSGSGMDALNTAVIVLRSIGVVLIAWALFQGAIMSPAFSDRVKLGMLFAAGLVFAFT